MGCTVRRLLLVVDPGLSVSEPPLELMPLVARPQSPIDAAGKLDKEVREGVDFNDTVFERMERGGCKVDVSAAVELPTGATALNIPAACNGTAKNSAWNPLRLAFPAHSQS